MKQAKGFVRDHKLTYPVLVDGEDRVAKAYFVGAVPSNVVISKSGIIRYVEAGYNEPALRKAIEAALME